MCHVVVTQVHGVGLADTVVLGVVLILGERSCGVVLDPLQEAVGKVAVDNALTNAAPASRRSGYESLSDPAYPLQNRLKPPLTKNIPSHI